MGVYFIEEVGTNRIKIGFSLDPEKRLRQMQTGNSRLLRLLFSIPGDSGLEQYCHSKYKHARVRPDGEWYYFDSQLRELFDAAVMHNSREPEWHQGLPVLRGIIIGLTDRWFVDEDRGVRYKSGYLQIYCPECQRAHQHGWNLVDGYDVLSYRVSHCDVGSAFSKGYFIGVAKIPGVHSHPPGTPIERLIRTVSHGTPMSFPN